MTKKEAIIKYITEMNTDMLSLILDDNKSYMDVSKETFLAGLDKVFNRLKNQEINKFSRVLEGFCGGDCNNGCGGYTFLTEDNQSLDLIVEEENEEVKDLYTCSIFINDEEVENRQAIYMSFYDDEKIDYIPSVRHIELQKQIERIFSELNHFKNNVTDLDTFCNWSALVEKLYDNINIYERISFKVIQPFQNFALENLYTRKLITFHPLAKKAMDDFNKIDLDNEAELIEWTLNYYDNELSYGVPEKVKNWEQNNLILHPLDKSIVLDCSAYSASLHFSEIQPKYYWELFEKYEITSKQFNEAKALKEDFQYDLITFLKIKGLYQQLDIFKIENKPIYLEYVIGKPKGTDQFIQVAGKELGINVKPEYIGSAYSFIDENGVTQIEASPEQTKNEIQNKKADKFYTQEIGLDWKSKLESKIIELYFSHSIDYLPF